jgi:excinuclease ABC subunit C
MKTVAKKLTKIIPALPGIYLFKNSDDAVIYIGKAKNLEKRIKSYFQKTHTDWKLQSLLSEYADIEYIITKNEIEACLLEAQLIAQHKPKFNVLLRDGQPFLYILFTNDELPTIKITRNKRQKGSYVGPFLHKQQVRKIYAYLMQTFKLNICNKKIPNGCLDYHIGTCPGTCMPTFNADEYLFRLQLARSALTGDHAQFEAHIKEKMQEYSTRHEFEKAKNIYQYLANSAIIFETIKTNFTAARFAHDIFVTTTPKPAVDTNIAHALSTFLQTPHAIRTIDCFDISHFQSRYLVGSCVRFTDGVPDKNKFRRFSIKTLTQQNDYAALQEIVSRRYTNEQYMPDLVLIDGGKGQLSAVKKVLPNSLCVSLAKQEERLFTPIYPDGILLDVKNPVGKLLIALRDYAHHFAISYHRLQRKKYNHR